MAKLPSTSHLSSARFSQQQIMSNSKPVVNDNKKPRGRTNESQEGPKRPKKDFLASMPPIPKVKESASKVKSILSCICLRPAQNLSGSGLLPILSCHNTSIFNLSRIKTDKKETGRKAALILCHWWESPQQKALC